MMLLALIVYTLFFAASILLTIWYARNRYRLLSAVGAITSMAYGIGFFFL